MNTAQKGRRAEHRARALLEADGFVACRAAGSKGPADLVAWQDTRFCSDACRTKGGRYKKAREAMSARHRFDRAVRELVAAADAL
jgi:Holliday junction resolvase